MLRDPSGAAHAGSPRGIRVGPGHRGLAKRSGPASGDGRARSGHRASQPQDNPRSGGCVGIGWSLRLSAVVPLWQRRRSFVLSGQQADAAQAIACTLEAPELKSRLAEIGALAGRVLLGYARDGRTLHLRYATDAAVELERLVDRERRCCGFLRLDLHHASDAVHLAIAAPTTAPTTAPITAPAATGEFAPMLYAHFIGQPLAPMSNCHTSCGCGSSRAG